MKEPIYFEMIPLEAPLGLHEVVLRVYERKTSRVLGEKRFGPHESLATVREQAHAYYTERLQAASAAVVN